MSSKRRKLVERPLTFTQVDKSVPVVLATSSALSSVPFVSYTTLRSTLTQVAPTFTPSAKVSPLWSVTLRTYKSPFLKPLGSAAV